MKTYYQMSVRMLIGIAFVSGCAKPNKLVSIRPQGASATATPSQNAPVLEVTAKNGKALIRWTLQESKAIESFEVSKSVGGKDAELVCLASDTENNCTDDKYNEKLNADYLLIAHYENGSSKDSNHVKLEAQSVLEPQMPVSTSFSGSGSGSTPAASTSFYANNNFVYDSSIMAHPVNLGSNFQTIFKAIYSDYEVDITAEMLCTSSDPAIASISPQNLIEAHSVGRTQISCIGNYGGAGIGSGAAIVVR